jgi:hypothetical protein
MVTARCLAVVALVVFLASIAFLTVHEDDPGQVPQQLTTTSVRIIRAERTSRAEILSRLADILRIRDEAYRTRSPGNLRSIYSSDCPCLRHDEKAIGELLTRDRKWDGIETWIEVRKAYKVNESLWVVVALLKSKALRIETLDGRLIRTEPAGSDLYEFTLVKPPSENRWLLGLVSDAEVNG